MVEPDHGHHWCGGPVRGATQPVRGATQPLVYHRVGAAT
jgi:hypothetical protein